MPDKARVDSRADAGAVRRVPVRYAIRPQDPAAHLYRVTCTIATPDADGQVLRLPAWIPGSYMIRDFARNIVALWAECGGEPVHCEKTDKSTWRCAPVDGELVVTWEVYAWDLSVRAAHLDDTHGYFNGTSVFLAVVGQEDAPCRLRIHPPEGERYRDWRVATTLRTSANTYPWQFGDYEADDYDELVDHPVETGTFTQARFTAAGVPHDIAITGVHRADTDRLCRDLARVCETQIRFFGEPAPVDRYLFMTTVVNEGYGGLEHRASTSLLAARDDLPLAGDDPATMKDAYRTYLGLCSHEYFHLWHVKRIKPSAFLPYDLRSESYTRLLWVFEGFTSYYDDLMLLRSGVIDLASYFELLGQTITRVLRTPGRLRQSVTDSSFDAWTKFYRQDENAPNAIVSYYAKGAVLALALDLQLRRRTQGQRSLDDVMRALWTRYGQPGVGVGEGDVEALVTEIGGGDMAEFFRRYVEGTEDPPLFALLAHAGIDLRLRAADGQSDNGGKPGRGDRERASLGIRAASDAAGARIQHCFSGGAAMKAGLSAGDVIVALDGLRATQPGLEKLLAQRRPGDEVRVHAFRRDELRECTVRLLPAPRDTAWLAPREGRAAEAGWPLAGTPPVDG